MARTRKGAAPVSETSVVEYLPHLVEAIHNAVVDDAQIESCIATLLGIPGSLFSACSVLRSRPLEPFLVVGRYGGHDLSDRSWIRWPLQRLFVMRRATVIEHPVLASHALALPLLHRGVRTVLLAPLDHAPETPEEKLILSILSAISLEAEPIASDIQSIGTPQFLWLGCDVQSQSKFESILRKRGWGLRPFTRLAEVTECVTHCAVPVVCIDSTVAHPSSILRALRSAHGSRVTVVTYGRVPLLPSDLEVLTDQVISLEADERRVLALLKIALRRSTAARIRETDAKVQHVRALIDDADSIEALVSESARATARFVEGWSNVQLVDSSGFVSLAEYPATTPPVASRLPNFFLESRSLLKTRVDDEFYEFVSSEESACDRLRDIGLISGVCIPLIDGERIIGTLVAGSVAASLEPNELDAVLQIAGHITSRAAALSSRNDPEAYFDQRRWTHIRQNDIELRVYRSIDCPLTAWFSKISAECSALVVASVNNVKRIAALLEPFERSSMQPQGMLDALCALPHEMPFMVALFHHDTAGLSFAARHMPAPALWNLTGPRGEVSSRDGMSLGAISLRGSGCVYLGHTQVLQFIDKSPGAVRAEIDRDRPDGILVCITTRSLAAG